jgi:hypothetical protein
MHTLSFHACVGTVHHGLHEDMLAPERPWDKKPGKSPASCGRIECNLCTRYEMF